MSINPYDINVSMLLSLLLANIIILSFNNFFVITVVREKNKVRLALAIPTGASTIVVSEIIDTPPLVALKTIKAWLI